MVGGICRMDSFVVSSRLEYMYIYTILRINILN